jgi:GntR family transcriptional regulator, transcriptional repressor for pyruvate dehydrogenase complex
VPGRPDGDLPLTRDVPSPVAPQGAALPSGPVRRVRKAYEQVYDQLRDWIMRGELSRGARLPSEAVLAREFGVSRGTVREALRVLAAQNLIRTAKGAGGGSFVTLPTVENISTFLHANISLLSESDDVTLPEFLEARELLEVFAARQCAARRTQEDIDRLRATIVTDPAELGTSAHYIANKEFHTAVLDGCGNTLVCIAAQPVFSVLQTRLRRERMPDSFARRLDDDHRAILDAIERSDSDAAGEEMRKHIEYLSRIYQDMWRPSPESD